MGHICKYEDLVWTLCNSFFQKFQSVVEEKSFGKAHCRCILWTKDGPKRLVVQGAHKTRSVKTVMGQLGLNVEQLPKEVSVF